MSIFSKITFNTLKKNKTRTAVTIIGIVLSAAMFTAVISFVSSMRTYLINFSIEGCGDWYGVVYSADNKMIDTVDDDSRVSNEFTMQGIGYASLSKVPNENKPYVYVAGAGDEFIDNMPVDLTEGRMPANSSEIIIPEHLINDGFQDYKIGDTITLDLGHREDADGNYLDQCKGYIEPEYGGSEKLVKEDTKSYTITGIYERPGFEPYSAPGYTLLTTQEENFNGRSDVYIKTDDPEDIYDVMNAVCAGKDNVHDDNSNLLNYLGTSSHDQFYTVLYGFATVLIGLIMFGSISLIYNAFSISVSERTRQFGILSSIGATKRQIFKSVIAEGVFLCIVGIPVGIICGLIGIGVTLNVVTSLVPAFNRFDNVSLELVVSLKPVLLAAVISAATVFLSAWIPARRAVKVTSIEAIKQSKDISTKNVRTTGISKLLFGFEGMLAAKYFKRYKKKYRATVISLFMSIVLFVSASSFCNYLKDSVGSVYDTADYDLSYSVGDNDSNESKVLDVINKTQGIEKCIPVKSNEISLVIDSSYLNDSFIHMQYLDEDADIQDTNIEAMAVDDDVFKEYLKKNNISDTDSYFNAADPKVITVARLDGINQGKYIKEDIFVKDPSELSCYEIKSEYYDLPNDVIDKMTDEEADKYKVKWNFKVGAFLNELPDCTNGFITNYITLVFPKSVYTQLMKDFKSDTYIIMKADDHKEVYNRLVDNLRREGIKTSSLYDYSEMVSNSRNLITVINIFSYGFIILISLIAVANVFNTITTNINLRRREFAMLRSVGMTQHGFYKMMDYECLLYGFKAILFGVPVSLLITAYMFRILQDAYTTSYMIPYKSIIIAVVCVFLVVFTTMIYAMQKIRNDNPIETLKNENL